VVIFGQDFDLAVKYSKKTLMQILVNKQFNLTLFEVPQIQLNSVQLKERLVDKELQPPPSQTLSGEQIDKKIALELVEGYALHPEVQELFKEEVCRALHETVKFWMLQ